MHFPCCVWNYLTSLHSLSNKLHWRTLQHYWVTVPKWQFMCYLSRRSELIQIFNWMIQHPVTLGFPLSNMTWDHTAVLAWLFTWNCIVSLSLVSLLALQAEYRKRGFTEVVSPNLYNIKLWQTSGHWSHYAVGFNHSLCHVDTYLPACV